MSLNRFALIAAVSLHNSHHGNIQNTSSSAGKSIASTNTPLPTQRPLLAGQQPLQSGAKSSTATTTATPPSTVTATPSMTLHKDTADGSDGGSDGRGGGGGGGTTGNSITTYYSGGLGLFHQQNIRANGINGSGGPSGGAYTNTINGNVNLLLGGAMLSLVTTILCVVCYCCHRNIKKRTEAAYRQQRQWLENDPNMEIYSVEQCYETSGLFFGESSDGLANLPALHHEPPPSYDAVVAMQEQQLLQHQQQQLMLQHQHQLQCSSPPPGYRSSLDVSLMPTGVTPTACGRGMPDGMAIGESSGNLSQGSQSSCTFQQLKPFAGRGSAGNGGTGVVAAVGFGAVGQNGLLSMKNAFNAQSCCSLQRAEVESMWHAAAAAVTARSMRYAANSGASPLPTTLTPTLMRARKSLSASYTGAGKASSSRHRHRYLNQSYYRRGCPLCGKFRYDPNADDDALSLSLSTESGLDLGSAAATRSLSTAAHVANSSEQGERRRGGFSNNNNNNNNNYDDFDNDEDDGDDFDYDRGAAAHRLSITASAHADDHDECLCETSQRNKNNNNNACSPLSPQRPAPPTSPPPHVAIATTPPPSIILRTSRYRSGAEGAKGGNSTQTWEDYENGNAPNQRLAPTAVTPGDPTADDNNSMAALQAAIATTETMSGNAAMSLERSAVDLDAINENGIVRLDMSKIIDRTGLPTYEAALKLESSGYV